jgi:hypothetical protein
LTPWSGDLALPELHRAFWRGITREKFIDLKIRALGQDWPLVVLGDGAHSNLVLALKGQAPFGKNLGVPGAKFRRMPAGLDPVPADSIRDIEQWINDGCPEGPTAS